MTKKDFELIASELRSQHEMLGFNNGSISGSDTTVYSMSCQLWAQVLSNTSPRFDRDRFLKACGIEIEKEIHTCENCSNETGYMDRLCENCQKEK